MAFGTCGAFAVPFRVLSRKEIELAPPRGGNILSHKYKQDLGTS